MTPRSHFQDGNAILRVSLRLALVGWVGIAIGLFVDPRQLAFSYLTAIAYAVSIALGALVFLMIGHVMDAGWPVAVRRLTETITSTLPALGALFVPVLLSARHLYPWLHPAGAHGEHGRRLLAHKQPFLNFPFFAARTCVYFAVWITVAALLRRWSLQQDTAPNAELRGRLRGLSAGALPPVAITLSFAAFDWLMSLTPEWYSTMYPVYSFAGGFLAALALLTVLTHHAQRQGFLAGVSASHYYALGRLLLAFTIFWAYVAFFQFMLMWAANRPEEVPYYAVRMHGAWSWVSIVVFVAQFVLPFLLLLDYGLKRRSAPLAALASWIVAVHYLDVHWLVAPAARPRGAPYHWLDLAALLAVGGVATAFAVYRLRGHAMLPINDPVLPKALKYESA